MLTIVASEFRGRVCEWNDFAYLGIPDEDEEKDRDDCITTYVVVLEDKRAK